MNSAIASPMRVPPDQFAEPVEARDMAGERPPIALGEDEAGLRGTPAVARSRLEQRVDLVKWAAREDVKAAWARVAEREGLERDAFEHATWGFLGFVLGRNFDVVISMSKARKAGWTGYQDTWEAFEATLKVLEAAKVLPARK